jgi:hypothetical protein
MLTENIYSTGVTQDDCHLRLSHFYSTGQWKNAPHLLVKKHLVHCHLADTVFGRYKCAPVSVCTIRYDQMTVGQMVFDQKTWNRKKGCNS